MHAGIQPGPAATVAAADIPERLCTVQQCTAVAPDLGQVQRLPILDQVDDAAGGADGDVDAPPQLRLLVGDGCACRSAMVHPLMDSTVAIMEMQACS